MIKKVVIIYWLINVFAMGQSWPVEKENVTNKALKIERELISLRASEKSPDSYIAIRSLLGRFSSQILPNQLRSFIQYTYPSRLIGTEGHTRAREFIISYLNQLDTAESGTSLTVQKFDPEFNIFLKQNLAEFKESEKVSNYIEELRKREFKGENILWKKKGSEESEDFLILASFYDSLAFDQEKAFSTESSMPGADRNASGLVALLSLVEILSQMNLPKTIKLIFFDANEFGNLGEKAFFDKHKEELNEHLLGYVNIQSIGHNSQQRQGNNLPFQLYYESSESVAEEFAESLVSKANLLRSSQRFSSSVLSPDMLVESSFFGSKLPVVILTHDQAEDRNLRHNSPNDLYETLNLTSYDQVWRSLVASIIGLSFSLEY